MSVQFFANDLPVELTTHSPDVNFVLWITHNLNYPSNVIALLKHYCWCNECIAVIIFHFKFSSFLVCFWYVWQISPVTSFVIVTIFTLLSYSFQKGYMVVLLTREVQGLSVHPGSTLMVHAPVKHPWWLKFPVFMQLFCG